MKELLELAMPEFEPVPDRIEQVRRKVRARRDRKVAAAAAATVLAVAAGAGVLAWRPADPEPANAAYQECQQLNVQPHIDDTKRRAEDAPVGASKVTLCVYEGVVATTRSGPGTGESYFTYTWELVGARDQQAGDGAIERKVNAMVPPAMWSKPTGQYRLVFDYPDRPRFVVLLTDKGDTPIPREEVLRGGDLLGLLDRMELSITYYRSPDQRVEDK